MLREKIVDYLEYSGISKALFCRRIGISYTYLRLFLTGQTDFSDELKIRIREYLAEFGRK